MFWVGRKNCNSYFYRDNFKEARNLAGKTGIVSLPLIFNFSSLEKANQYNMAEAYLKARRQATEDEINNGKREVFIDFRNGTNVVVKLKNQLKFNKTVREEVKDHDEQNPNF